MIEPIGKARYRALVSRSDDAIPLEEAAALLAGIAYPDAEPEPVVARLDAFAARARALAGERPGDVAILEAVCDALFREGGLAGNEDRYYDPRNSYLCDVLALRKGIPITLSVIFLAVARRAGLRAEGVGFPGHFLVRCWAGGQGLLLDPYAGGRIVSRRELEGRLRAASGGAELRDEHTRAATHREILTRMLNNLRAIYLRTKDLMHAAEVLEWLLATNPDSPELLRDRGIVFRGLECYPAAIADLRAYAAARPDAPDLRTVAALIAEMEGREVVAH